MRFCEHCEAVLPKGSQFCPECGAAVEPEPATATATATAAVEAGAEAESTPSNAERSTPRRSPQRDRVERSAANRELGRAVQALSRVETLYSVLIVISLINLLVFVLRAWGPFMESGIFWLITLVMLLELGVLVVGRLRLRTNPFVWSLVLAALMTVNILTVLAFGDGLPILGILMTVAAWSAVGLLSGIRPLMEKYPDLRATQRIRGESTRREGPRGEIGAKLAERRAAERRRRWTRIGAVGAAVVAVIALLWWWPFGNGGAENNAHAAPRVAGPRGYQLPNEPLDPVVAQFESAWQAKSYDDLGALYPERMGRRASRLERRFEKHGFTAFSELGEGRTRTTGDNKQMVTYRTADGVIEAVFEFESGAWCMVALRLK